MEPIESLIAKLESDKNDALTQLYGSSEIAYQQQKERYLGLMHQFIQTYGSKPVAVFSSPGRTEIGGNHTDHNHGKVLAGAVNLDNIAVAAPNNREVIRIASAGYPDFEVQLGQLQPDQNELYTTTALVRGICARMLELGFTIGGFDACIDGRVPKGSGLSSSASFEVLIGAIISHLFNHGKLDPVENAKIGQFAENHFFGKPCGLMDQTACSFGGLVAIDFENPTNPVVQKVGFDFKTSGFALIITDTGGNHANLNDEYAALPYEMKSVAHQLGAQVLRSVTHEKLVQHIPALRKLTGDRAILRALHFVGENKRVADQVAALESNNFKAFLSMVIASGQSSFMYNQNIYPSSDPGDQGVSLALALSDQVLNGKGAWRVHGGGFAGTIQAFVPDALVQHYIETLESVFGKDKCHALFIRPQGAIRVAI